MGWELRISGYGAAVWRVGEEVGGWCMGRIVRGLTRVERINCGIKKYFMEIIIGYLC